MKIPYCLPILKERKTDVLKMIQENIHRYPYFEVWLDYVEGVDEAFFGGLAESLKGRLVVVLRRKNLEQTRLSLEQKTDLMLSLENSQSLLDLDIGTQQEELGFVQAHSLKIKVITSYHDYRETPDDKTLEQVVDTMKRYNPAIYKIATLCQCQQDALRLLQLLLKLKSENMKCIVLGMGNFGAVTRVFGTLWGNELIFAPEISAGRSAEGQLTRNQLQAVFRELMR
jgi:3-dehydroquinate dehydratase I